MVPEMSSEPPPPHVWREPAGLTVQLKPLKLPALPEVSEQLKRCPTVAVPTVHPMVMVAGVGGGGGGGAMAVTLSDVLALTGWPVPMSVAEREIGRAHV